MLEEKTCPGCGAPVEEQIKANEASDQNSEAQTSEAKYVFNTEAPPHSTIDKTQAKFTDENGVVYGVIYGGFWRRVVATWIDTIILSILISTGIGSIVALVYAPLCEAYWNGSTIGKKVMGLKVVNASFDKITLGQAIGRSFGKILCVCSLYIGFLMVAFSRQKRGLHDILAGTYVIATK